MVTLLDAALYITKLPKAEHDADEAGRDGLTPGPGQAAESFVGCDAFYQRNKLALHCLVFHRGIGPQQPQAESAIHKQQALDLALAIARAFSQTVIVKEKRHRDIKRRGDLLQARRANPVDAFLVFLHLLEGDAELVGKPQLRDINLNPAQPNALAEFNVVLAARPWIFEAAVRFLFAVADNAQCGFPCHGLGLSHPLTAG
jgi:hypothetical protein